MSLRLELIELNNQKERMRLELANLKRKTKIVSELMAKHKRKLPNYQEEKVRSFLKSAEKVD